MRDIYACRPSPRTLSFQLHPIIYHLISIEWQKLPPAQALHPSPHQQIYNQMCMMKGEKPLYVRDITTNHLYRRLVEKNIERPTSETRWESIYHLRMCSRDWKHVWTTVKEIAQTLPAAWDRDIHTMENLLQSTPYPTKTGKVEPNTREWMSCL